MKALLVALNAVLLALIFWVGVYWEPAGDDAPLAMAAAPQGGDFTLDGVHGPVSLHDFRGKVVVLYFGYTYCPDICPTSLAILGQALEQLTPAELARVQPIFVSVDPERDSPAQLAGYTRFFHPSIIGVTGTPDRLAAIARQYGAAYARQQDSSAGGYVVDHTALTYVIDPAGNLVASLAHGTPADQVLATLRKILSTP